MVQRDRIFERLSAAFGAYVHREDQPSRVG